MRRSLRLALALGALTALPAPAFAASRVFPVTADNAAPAPLLREYVRVAGPFLAGENTVFLDRGPASLAVVADRPGSRRELLTLPDELGEDRLRVAFDVADGRLALATWIETCNGDEDCARYQQQTHQDHVLRGGAIDGPIQTLASCATEQVSVAATALVAGCGESFDLFEDGRPPEHVATPRLILPRVAGEFVALLALDGPTTPIGVRVLRRSDRSEVFRVDAPITGFDLAPDGTVVYPLGPNRRAIGWSSPAEPSVHEIAIPDEGRAVTAVVAAGGRFAARLGGRDGRVVVLERDGSISDEVYDRAMLGGVDDDNIDFDGGRVTWAREPCTRQEIVVWDLAEPVPPLTGERCDPPAIEFTEPAPLRLGRDRRVTATITCPAAASAGCAGAASLAVYLRKKPSSRRRLRGSRATGYDLLPGEVQTARVRVRKKGLKRFRTGRVVARVSVLRELEEIVARRALELR